MKKRLVAIGIVMTMVLGAAGCNKEEASDTRRLDAVRNAVMESSEESEDVDALESESEEENESFPEVEPFVQPMSEHVDNADTCFYWRMICLLYIWTKMQA